MAEAIEEAGTEKSAEPDKPNPAAMAMALGRTKRSSKLDAKAEAFLDGQTRLTDIQTEHLHEQRELMLSRLRWGRFSDRMKAVLQTMTALVGVAVAAGVASMAWQAHEDHGLVVEGFSAPPSFAARGYSGQVLAEDLIGRVNAIRLIATGSSLSTSGDVRADQADALKVDIPGTGVSLEDLERSLRRWFGHEVPVTGDLRDEGGGQISIGLHIAGAEPILVTGAAGDLDGLMQSAAEKAFAAFDPENVVLYDYAQGRMAEAEVAAQHNALVQTGPLELADAYSLWGYIDGDARRSLSRALISIRIAPQSTNGWRGLGDASLQLGHDQAAVHFYQRLLQSKVGDQIPRQRDQFPWLMLHGKTAIDQAMGDYRDLATPPEQTSFDTLADNYATAAFGAGLQRDGSQMRRDLAAASAAGPLIRGLRRALEARWYYSSGIEDWPHAVSDAKALIAFETARKAAAPTPDWVGVSELHLATAYRPWLAHAEAMAGDLPSAAALIASTPLDCYLCVRVRGQIAAAARDWSGADRWLAEAVRQAPDLPSAYAEWGAALLARGDVADAIAKLQLAHEKGPHFADPLETWGEALMRQGDFAGASAKFAEADADAPRWGRNHLMWGETLMLAGRYAEARAQFVGADGMDLSGADRAALKVLLTRTATAPLHG